MQKLKTILQSKTFFIILILITFIYCLIYINIPKNSKYSIATTSLNGIILNYNLNDDVLSLTIKAKEKIKATYYLKNVAEKNDILQDLAIGAKIKINGKMVKPTNNTIPNTFNYQKYLYYDHIYYLFLINDYQITESNNIFMKIKNFFYKRVNNISNNAYLKTFILGDKSDLAQEVYLNYQSNGVSHLFAISGMHISLFSTLILFIFRKFKHKEILNLFILWFYVFIVGFAPAIVRTITFFSCLYFNKKYNLNFSTLKCLLFSGLVIILFNPFMLFKISFQYSFIVTLGLILANSYVKSSNYFWQLIKLSFIATLISLPITIYNFYEINLLSIITNLVFVPLITFIYYPLALVTYIFSFLAPFYNFLIIILEKINNLFANITFLKIVIPKINIIFLSIYYLILFCYLKYNKKFIIGLFIIILIGKYQFIFNKKLIVNYLDVGQGDSSLIIFPNHKESILIDTGGIVKYNASNDKNNINYTVNNLILFFKSQGLKQIDYLIISHGDYDHLGNALDLIKNFKVKKVIFNCGNFNDLEQDLIEFLNDKQITFSNCPNKLIINNTEFLFLKTQIYNNENDNSNIIYTKLNNYQFLFMGDASTNVEAKLLKKYQLNNIDFLKVGHHGSKTSSSKSFIDKIKPQYSIISVGKNNNYGHPNKEVLFNLKNTNIYRTDIVGSIVFKFNSKLEVETYPP